MLFNSFPFLCIYLPIVLAGYQIAGRFRRKGIVLWLGAASLAFYVYWYPPFVLILGTSVLVNYFMSALISRRIPNSADTRVWLWLSIALNLGALGYFKYSIALLRFSSHLLHTGSTWHSILLPLGISFFTFTQIAFLVDLQQGAAEQQDYPSYLLFVTFFPHLIAGPILHHASIMPQFKEDRIYRLNASDLSVGFSWFIMGLFKKVMIADTFALFLGTAYSGDRTLSALDSWIAVLAYALQLYFDFSGYSDMALGLARMLSIQFPLNFASPYKSANIIDYWNRWHMTLTQYITSYVFSPMQILVTNWRMNRGLKVSRKARATLPGFAQMIALPTLFTMLIAGIWHGAGLQYIVFGLLHGVYITVAHAWRVLRSEKPNLLPESLGPRTRHLFSVALTLLAVLLAQVVFRAENTRDAFILIAGLFGLHPAPHPFASTLSLPLLLSRVLYLAAGAFIVFMLPNTQQILSRYKPSLALADSDLKPATLPFYWDPQATWAISLGLALLLAMVHFRDSSKFLYFQF